MAKGQHLSNHQRGIVKRYYKHLDTLTAQRLQELVSELYLCDTDAKRNKLWQRAHESLLKTGANPARIDKVMADRSIEALARLIGEVTAPAK